jgi:hypothetical protein
LAVSERLSTEIQAVVFTTPPELAMRSAGNFHPEWGYLRPARSFMGYVRIALVSAAVGATSSAAVVFSLVRQTDTGDDVAAIVPHTLEAKAPAIAARVGTPSFVNTNAATVLMKNIAQPSRLAAHSALPSSDPTLPLRLRAILRTPEPSGMASKSIVPAADSGAGFEKELPVGELAPALQTPPAKVVEREKGSSRRRHWRSAANGRSYHRRFNRNVGLPGQFRYSRPTVQLGFAERRDEW